MTGQPGSRHLAGKFSGTNPYGAFSSGGQRTSSGIANSGVGGTSASQAMAPGSLNNGFGNGQKMNAGGRIRARNPVLMSMQNNSSQQTGADIMG